MNPTPNLDIDYVARLARLDLTPEEKATFSHQLADVLHHIEQLAKVEVSGVEPTAHAFPVENVWAPDEPAAGLAVEAALRNAPARRSSEAAASASAPSSSKELKARTRPSTALVRAATACSSSTAEISRPASSAASSSRV